MKCNGRKQVPLLNIFFRSVDSDFSYRSLFHILHSRNSAHILQNVIMNTHAESTTVTVLMI